MDCIVHGVAKSRTQLSDLHSGRYVKELTNYWGFPMAQWVKNVSANARDTRDTVGPIAGLGTSPWSRKWQPTPVLLPGKFHGWRSLVGYSPWCRKELDTTEQLHFHFFSTGK